MKYFLATLTLICLAAAAAFTQQRGGPPAPPMKLTVSGYADGAEIPTKFTCTNAPSGTSPALVWTNAPQGTASFVLLLHDPEGHPQKGVYDVTHWLVWNIPADVHELPEGLPAKPELDNGAHQAKSIRGNPGYFGPCAPPNAPHHYTYDLYALDTKLDLPADAGRADVMMAMDGHILATAIYVGIYHRPQ